MDTLSEHAGHGSVRGVGTWGADALEILNTYDRTRDKLTMPEEVRHSPIHWTKNCCTKCTTLSADREYKKKGPCYTK